eukprot:3219020-Pleurochrysis_carterae.AAC.1
MHVTANPVYWWPTPMTRPHRAIPCSLRRAPLHPRTCKPRLVKRGPNHSPCWPKPMCLLLHLLPHPSQPRVSRLSLRMKQSAISWRLN